MTRTSTLFACVLLVTSSASFSAAAAEPHGMESLLPTAKASAEREKPAHLLVLRLAPGVLTAREESRQVNETARVSEAVLGTHAVGTARVGGEVAVDFAPNRENAGLTLTFAGTSVSRTTSRLRPATIHTVVTSRFVARKPIIFDLEEGFHYGEATTEAWVESTRRSVQSTAGGLRGRLVRRIAHRRLNALNGYLNEVARESTSRRVQQSFEREANRRLVVLNNTFKAIRLALRQQISQQDGEDYGLSLNTTDRYLQIGVGPRGLPNPTLPDEGVAPMPVQLWLHASLFGEPAEYVVDRVDELRLLLPTPNNISGLTTALRLQQQGDETLPLQSLEFAAAAPWVVLGAGRERVRFARRTPEEIRPQ